MTTSQTQFFSELEAGHSGPPIPEAKRVYFQARLRNRLFNFILDRFVEEQKNGLTKAKLGRRIGKSDAVVNRLLGAPSNLTLDTASDLLLGISAEELTPQAESLLNQSPQNYWHADWIKQPEDQTKRARPSPPEALTADGHGERDKFPPVPLGP
jgi:hypothetical protein